MPEGQENSPESKIKLVIPQLVEKTGVSADFYNEFMVVSDLMLTNLENEMTEDELKQEIIDMIRKYPPRHYEEHFPPEKYGSVVNDKNREAIRELDSLIDFINGHMVDPNNFTLDDAHRINDRAWYLIQGKTDEGKE